MNKKELVEWKKEKDKQLSWLYEITDHGKAFLSPRIRDEILGVFTNDPNLAWIDRESISLVHSRMEAIISIAEALKDVEE